jgi:Zn-dependent protease with chaperone function
MEERAISKTKSKVTTTVHAIEHTDSELYKVGMYTTAAFAIGVGAWAMICLSSGILENGSPMDLLKNLFQAITGA